MTEIEDERFWGKHRKEPIDCLVERLAAAEQSQRIEVALHRHAPLDLVACEDRIDCPIEPDRIDRNLFDIAQQGGPDPARKSNDFRSRHLLANFGDHTLARLDAPSAQFFGRQHPGPGIEDLHRIDACLQLSDQIARGSIDQDIDQLREPVGITIGEQSCRGLIRRAMAGDHIACNGPRCSAKTQQRHTAIELCFDHPNGLVDRRQRFMIDLRPQPSQAGAIHNRIELWTLTGRIPHRLTECMWEQPECPRTGSPHQSRNGAPAAT